MEAVNKPYLSALTGLRGFAALWVVFYHFKGNAGIAGVLDLGRWANYGAWGVEIFFVLSGFVLSYVYAQQFHERFNLTFYWKYLALRLGRIYPLHVILLAFFGALVFLGQLFGIQPGHPENFRLEDLGWSLVLMHAWGVTDPLNWNYVSWSISAEWFAYLFLLPGYIWLGKRLGTSVLLLTAAVSWVVFFVLGATDQEWRYLDQYEHALWRICNDFFLGYALYRFWSERNGIFPAAGLSLAFSIAVIIGLAYTPGEFRILLLPAVAILILSLASGGDLGRLLCGNRVMIFLGEISYAIYMVHPAVQVMSNAVVRRFGLVGDAYTAIAILIADVVLVLLASTCAYYLIEHPCREWVRRKL